MTEQNIEQLHAELSLFRTVEAIRIKLSDAKTYQDILAIIHEPFINTDLARVTFFYYHKDEQGQPTAIEVKAFIDNLNSSALEVGTRMPYQGYPSLAAMFTSAEKVFISDNVATDPNLDDGLRDYLQQLGAGAVVFMPVVRLEEWVGLVSFAWIQPHAFTAHERALFHKFGQLIPPFIQNRHLIENLETRVAERTQELERVSQAVEATTDGIAIVDENNLTIYHNPAMFRMTGYTGEEINAMGGGPGIFEDQTFIGEIVELLQQGKSWAGETSIIHKKGRKVAILFRITPLINADGSYGGAVVIQTDMTDQKKIEAERATMQQKIIETQQEALRTLSTPIIPIMDRVIILPLIGHIDIERANSIMRSLLHSISQERAKVIILDITGVPTINSEVAGYLSKTIMAARLKGCRTIITGISDAVAETIIDLGIDWGTDIDLVSDLQSGLVSAVGYLERSWYHWQGQSR